jgi:hypothetical protein
LTKTDDGKCMVHKLGFYGTWKIITASVSASCWALPPATWSTSCLQSKIQLYVTFLSGRYFPKWFSGKGTPYEGLYPSHAFYMSRWSYPFPFDPLNNKSWEVQITKLLKM